MYNLYTMKMSVDEVRGLMRHFQLVGTQWAEAFARDQAGMNESRLVYSKYPAPVVIVKDGVETLEKMRWGMPGRVSTNRRSRPPAGGSGSDKARSMKA
jgi:hypothetical protein